MSQTYSHGGFQVTVASDGAILVKPGDSLSKYSMAIHHNFDHCREYGRRSGGAYEVTPIQNINHISAGETIYHIPTNGKGKQTPNVTTPVTPVAPSVARRVALLTCVTNNGAMGPGHTAVIIDGNVYTFEAVWGSWGTASSGWVKFNTRKYLQINTHRPVVIQELRDSHVKASKVSDYINQSMDNDDDYIGSGVCSQQAAEAISAGSPRTVNPSGFNTPWKIYNAIQQTGWVKDVYHIYAKEKQNARGLLILQAEYMHASRKNVSRAPILNW